MSEYIQLFCREIADEKQKEEGVSDINSIT